MPYIDTVDPDSTRGRELARYCKSENVPLAVLLYVDDPRPTIRTRMKSVVCHLLQRVDRRINAMIARLSPDVEHSRIMRRQL